MRGSVILTGGSGFLGSEMLRALLADGYTVHALARDPAAGREREPRAQWHSHRLPEPLAGGLLEKLAESRPVAFIHCGYDLSLPPERAYVSNVDGARRLLSEWRSLGTGPFVFVSSQAAHPAALSAYGRSKLAIESCLDPGSDLILRPALVIGDGGIVGRLVETIRRVPVVPLFYGNPRVQTVGVADVSRALVESLSRQLHGTLELAHPESLPIRDLYRGLAELAGRKPWFLHLPGEPALVIARALERWTRIALPVTSESLLGLKRIRLADPAPTWERLGMRPRSFAQLLAELGSVSS